MESVMIDTTTDALRAETVEIAGHNGDTIEAYFATPLGAGPYGGVVVIHHMPGYDEATKEIVRKFAHHGYLALMPNLYSREAPGAAPDDAAATARARGGVPDERLVADVAGAQKFLTSRQETNHKLGVIGYCSGGRQSFLAACSLPFDAAVDCYGAFVVANPPTESPLKVTSLLHLADKLSCPLLGLFGADDKYPAPSEVAELEATLTELGKEFDFHTYEGAGHAFFSTDRPSYRPEAATDGWQRVFSFFAKHLGS
jgi:carboxymethylenebutenolidase